MRRPVAPQTPLVVKVGSSSLASTSGVSVEAVTAVIDLVSQAMEASHPTVLVTSGAVAAGLPALKLARRPADLAGLQVAAAVGQGKLMELYSAGLATRGISRGPSSPHPRCPR